MKTKTFFASLLFGALTVPSVAEEISDTLIVKRPEKVTIITQDTLQRITVKGSKQNADYRYVQTISYADTSVVKRKTFGLKELVCGVKKCEGKKGTVTTDGYLNIGLNTMLDAERGSYNLWPSFDVAIGMTADWHPFGAKNVWSLGLGFDWRNYRMTDRMFVKQPDGVTITSSFPEGTEPKFSRIHTFSLSFPLKYYHYFSKKIFFAVGPELYVTPWASLKTKYYDATGEEQKITAGNLHENRVSVGVGAEINIHHIGIYYKYNPFNVLSSSFGPGFASMTTGIKIAF